MIRSAAASSGASGHCCTAFTQASCLVHVQFGKVYLGRWCGTLVAVKSMVLSSAMSRSKDSERMALMEVAISSSLHHPHLVQTFTYSLKPLMNERDRQEHEREQGSESASRWVRLHWQHRGRGPSIDYPSSVLCALANMRAMAHNLCSGTQTWMGRHLAFAGTHSLTCPAGSAPAPASMAPATMRLSRT